LETIGTKIFGTTVSEFGNTGYFGIFSSFFLKKYTENSETFCIIEFAGNTRVFRIFATFCFKKIYKNFLKAGTEKQRSGFSGEMAIRDFDIPENEIRDFDIRENDIRDFNIWDNEFGILANYR